MTWEWSHTDEAYAAVHEQLLAKPREWLIEVYAEWGGPASGTRHATHGRN